jgi:hypothetical protein
MSEQRCIKCTDVELSRKDKIHHTSVALLTVACILRICDLLRIFESLSSTDTWV